MLYSIPERNTFVNPGRVLFDIFFYCLILLYPVILWGGGA